MLSLPTRSAASTDHPWSLDSNDRWTRKAYIATSTLEGEYNPNTEIIIVTDKKNPLGYFQDNKEVLFDDSTAASPGLNVRGLQHLLYFLDHPDPDTANQAASYLVFYLDPRRSIPLFRKLAQSHEWRHLSAFHKDYYRQLSSRSRLWLPKRKITGAHWETYLEMYKRAGQQAAVKQAKHAKELYCLEHYKRFDQSISGIQGAYNYSACSTCKSTVDSIQITYVIAVLDPEMEEAITVSGTILKVNALKRDQPFHMDELNIRSCTRDDIEHFCIYIGNDTDQTRIDSYKRAKVLIADNMTLTQESKRGLSRFFSLSN